MKDKKLSQICFLAIFTSILAACSDSQEGVSLPPHPIVDKYIDAVAIYEDGTYTQALDAYESLAEYIVDTPREQLPLYVKRDEMLGYVYLRLYNLYDYAEETEKANEALKKSLSLLKDAPVIEIKGDTFEAQLESLKAISEKAEAEVNPNWKKDKTSQG